MLTWEKVKGSVLIFINIITVGEAAMGVWVGGWGLFYKKVFLKISQNSQKNTCAKVSFSIKLQTWGLNFIKKETLVQVFSGEFCEIFRAAFLQNNSERLFLSLL